MSIFVFESLRKVCKKKKMYKRTACISIHFFPMLITRYKSFQTAHTVFHGINLKLKVTIPRRASSLIDDCMHFWKTLGQLFCPRCHKRIAIFIVFLIIVSVLASYFFLSRKGSLMIYDGRKILTEHNCTFFEIFACFSDRSHAFSI